jgi:hypothetical protein
MSNGFGCYPAKPCNSYRFDRSKLFLRFLTRRARADQTLNQTFELWGILTMAWRSDQCLQRFWQCDCCALGENGIAWSVIWIVVFEASFSHKVDSIGKTREKGSLLINWEFDYIQSEFGIDSRNNVMLHTSQIWVTMMPRCRPFQFPEYLEKVCDMPSNQSPK